MAVPTREARAGSSRFAFWRLGLWLVLLLAAFGCLQYLGHARLLWPALHAMAMDAADRAALRTMLAWDVAYFVLSFVVIVLCAGGILRQAWARMPLRVCLAVLALWMLASAGWLLYQWHAWRQAQQAAGVAFDVLQQARRGVFMGVGLKLVAVPLLSWLAWRLGHPAVRAQFHHRR